MLHRTQGKNKPNVEYGQDILQFKNSKVDLNSTEMARFLLSAYTHLVSSEVSGLRALSFHFTTLGPLLGVLHPANAGHPARDVGPLLT